MWAGAYKNAYCAAAFSSSLEFLRRTLRISAPCLIHIAILSDAVTK
ncbi:hypothetical protein UYSO10_2963 [Kosakonia radicincitans]|nr:hypothetical protein UYSO10_2963 [Kosakonia radicincitans]